MGSNHSLSYLLLYFIPKYNFFQALKWIPSYECFKPYGQHRLWPFLSCYSYILRKWVVYLRYETLILTHFWLFWNFSGESTYKKYRKLSCTDWFPQVIFAFKNTNSRKCCPNENWKTGKLLLKLNCRLILSTSSFSFRYEYPWNWFCNKFSGINR